MLPECVFACIPPLDACVVLLQSKVESKRENKQAGYLQAAEVPPAQGSRQEQQDATVETFDAGHHSEA